MVNRYVNTLSTAGGDGTTNATSGASRAFAALREAIDSLGTSLSDATTIWCEGSVADTSDVYQTPWDMTTTAANYLQIIGEQSPLHPNFSTVKSGKYDTSLYRLERTNQHVLYNNLPAHVIWRGLQAKCTATDAGSYNCFRMTNANQVGTGGFFEVSECIAVGVVSGGSTVYGFQPGVTTGAGGICKTWNCIAIDCSQGFVGAGTGHEFWNCTAADCVTSGFTEDVPCVLKNCLSKGASVGFIGTFTGSSNNAEDDGNGAPGSNPRSGVTFTFVNAAADDFHLASTDTGAKGFGISDPGSGAFDDDIDGQTRGATWDIGFDQYVPPSIEQEGFRWGVDDGAESAHTWEAAQDTDITLPDTQSRLLRVLVNTPEDPAAQAYTLRSQKNGSGGYVVVPVGSTITTSPPTAPTATVTTVGTATDPWTINRSIASSGDLVIFVLAWDDSTNTTAVTAPAGANSETAVSIAGPVASASTEMRMQAWYYIATGAWSSGTLSFDPNASETVRAVSFTIPAGQFNASDPIGWANTTASVGTAESNVNSPTGTTESNDGDGRMYIGFGSDADALTVPGSNWNTINNATGGGVGLAVGSRNTLASNSESVTALTATIPSDSWASLAFVVKPNVVNNEVYITTSANITAGGEATTARLTAPSGKTTGDFVTGRRWDDENGTDTIDLTSNDYTEVEWLVALSADPVDTDYFEFRVYAGSTALTTYTLTPKWTVGSGGGGAASRQSLLLMGMGR